jgi:copper chaperone CopZ
MQQLDVTVRGMSCGHCVASVRQALEATDGITVDRVTVGSATVQYDPATVQPEHVVARIKEAGFDASIAAL